MISNGMNLFLDLFSTKVAYAESLNDFITHADKLIINPLISLLFALAVVYFLYGVLEFFMNQENEEKRSASKSHMLWGIIGITIMLGVWVILGMIINTFGIQGVQINSDGTNKVQLPQ
jgi:succinate dehydrogenase/fumarate reductase cytochrome b subunit